MTAVAIPGLAYAEANWGRWIARCPAGLCTNAIQVARRQQTFECIGAGSCGWTSTIVWPADPESIEVLLALRPDEKTRSWLPGESLAQLLAENTAHGLPIPGFDPAHLPPGTTTVDLLTEVDGRAVSGVVHDLVEQYRAHLPAAGVLASQSKE